MIEQWKQDLAQFVNPLNIKTNELLKNYTMTKLGGKADVFVMPATEEEAVAVVRYAKTNNVPLLMLGNGSNMVVRDGGVRGIVLHFAHLDHVDINGTTVVAGAGALIKEVSKRVAAECLTGFEFACGIPGSIGGAMAMNAGAYGGEMKDVLKEVTVMTAAGEILVLPAEKLEMGYRTSLVKTKGYLVLSAVIVLEQGNQEAIKARMKELTEQRVSKQPLEFPSAGSTFKRPEGYFAGKLIMDAGLRGYQTGGAQVSEKHCGFVINKDNATAADVCRLLRDVQDKVKEQFGVTLEPEVKFLGKF